MFTGADETADMYVERHTMELKDSGCPSVMVREVSGFPHHERMGRAAKRLLGAWRRLGGCKGIDEASISRKSCSERSSPWIGRIVERFGPVLSKSRTDHHPTSRLHAPITHVVACSVEVP